MNSPVTILEALKAKKQISEATKISESLTDEKLEKLLIKILGDSNEFNDIISFEEQELPTKSRGVTVYQGDKSWNLTITD